MVIISYLIFFLLGAVHAQSKDYYIGAVVEYAPTYDENQIPAKNIQRNLDEYEKYIKTAKDNNTDIIVFPEFGLTGILKQQNINLFTAVLPDPEDKIIACGLNNTWSLVIQRLSCAAKDNKIYVVVNLPERKVFASPENKQLYFSSTVVFDRNGTLIARYRKFNMNEKFFNTTEKPDLTYFETDFNVTFGVFTTSDILFSQPALHLLRENKRVTDIIYTTAWQSELPFLTGVQMQAGWARANGVNLLAASYCDPQNYYGGSGIYQASGEFFYNIPAQKESISFSKKIYKIKERVIPESYNNTSANVSKVKPINSNLFLSTLKEDMSRYKSQLITDKETHDLCHGNLCCTFKFKFSPLEKPEYSYRMVAYDGPRNITNTRHNIQICGFVACLNQNISSCGDLNLSPSNSKPFDEISISGTFIDQGNTVIFPTNVLYNLEILDPLNYTFKSSKHDHQRFIEISTTTVREILGFGIYSFTQDTYISHRGLSGGAIAGIVIVILVVIAVIAFFIWRRFRKSKYNHRVTI